MNRTASKVWVAVFILLALASIFVLMPVLSSSATYSHQVARLDEKRGNVLALANAAAITSALITAIPDDTATPIAQQLAELSKVFILIMAVLLAEKYLLTVFGLIASVMLVVVNMLGMAFCMGLREGWLRDMAVKLLILAVAFGTLIPCSVLVTDMIEKTYEESISGVVNQALVSEYELQQQESGKNVLQQLVDQINRAFTMVTKMGERLKAILSRFIEASAVMVVTSCIVPVLVLVLYLVGIKLLFNLDGRRYEALAVKQLARIARRTGGQLQEM